MSGEMRRFIRAGKQAGLIYTVWPISQWLSGTSGFISLYIHSTWTWVISCSQVWNPHFCTTHRNNYCFISSDLSVEFSGYFSLTVAPDIIGTRFKYIISMYLSHMKFHNATRNTKVKTHDINFCVYLLTSTSTSTNQTRLLYLFNRFVFWQML